MSFLDWIKESFRPEIILDSEKLERERKRLEDGEHLDYLISFVSLSPRNLENERKKNSFLRYPAASPRVKHKKILVKVRKTEDIFSSVKELEKEMKLHLFCGGCGMGTEFRIWESGGFLFGEAVPVERGFYQL